jgi:hypothetical protein
LVERGVEGKISIGIGHNGTQEETLIVSALDNIEIIRISYSEYSYALI